LDFISQTCGFSYFSPNSYSGGENIKIQTRSYFTGNALFHPAYEDLAKEHANPREEFPIATKTTIDTFFLGVYPGISDEQMDYIGAMVDQFIESKK
jgi:CDP-6-deoxy-D-xylo-4-hexulose-3-dehydrase